MDAPLAHAALHACMHPTAQRTYGGLQLVCSPHTSHHCADSQPVPGQATGGGHNKARVGGYTLALAPRNMHLHPSLLKRRQLYLHDPLLTHTHTHTAAVASACTSTLLHAPVQSAPLIYIWYCLAALPTRHLPSPSLKTNTHTIHSQVHTLTHRNCSNAARPTWSWLPVMYLMHCAGLSKP